LEISPEKIDLIFCPAVAVDFAGNRIGNGGGAFDRFLQNCRGKKVAVVFAAQVSREILPAEKHDQKMDFVATENGISQI